MAGSEAESGGETHFGFRTVPLGEKQRMVDEVFHSVARRYDLMNDLMSMGLHRVWKDLLVSRLRPPKTDRPFALLDVAGGTGDVSFRTVEAGGAGTRATVADINGGMLGVGRERAASLGLAERVEFVEANAESLPFADRSFDATTIAFGIRNVPRMDKALSEMRRVLKPGGKCFVLEFSRVDVPMLDAIYDTYSFKLIPGMGKMVTGDAESYQYLVESIRRFPAPELFAQMMREAGLKRVGYTPLTGGIVCLHAGVRI
ncbi:bifunctional demethylmenaquinone methyltransferase/2-methoxy-6-polyprenyl-1,4-benzoquinol methylase UbiE [Ancylobacter sp. SL191]|uniref:bifunctional demethylmenaquinone methyltransferase/2-methoxy-6-polyprenyl-1,4-benzoquinol methylase UbiE n=1 Tax=Ancylobacter sp. SL191 TaxID=2995166 RepID=UPI00226F83FB|nr:bifunctional demethylmenaquinone methyltransferase/2-methoxy-6-polyprenyl-1,4-benzoquinol methylase UbiE [Ancylobacter sp. SL191]WAC28107.1 bifunctional demethylmenaquinone methyltransferase/2-methoxy-6-polyprenyl-1,4-benzoquinol methylase UbiE [Ancylobacter sp. SL191]